MMMMAGLVLLPSCLEEEDPLAQLDTIDDNTLDANLVTEVSSESVMETSYEEMDLITDESINNVFRMTTGAQDNRGPRINCADITHDTLNNLITIDFGLGCEDHRGAIRSGVITIAFDGAPRKPGSSRVITFNDFYIDSIKVEGTRTLTILEDTTSNQSALIMTSKLEGGKLTFADGTFITRDAEHSRMTTRGENIGEGTTTLTGEASGMLRNGENYSSTIIEPVVFVRGCEEQAPVSGIKEFAAGTHQRMIDFGDGACDNLAEVTTDGVTETIELQGRRRFRETRDQPKNGG